MGQFDRDVPEPSRIVGALGPLGLADGDRMTLKLSEPTRTEVSHRRSHRPPTAAPQGGEGAHWGRLGHQQVGDPQQTTGQCPEYPSGVLVPRGWCAIPQGGRQRDRRRIGRGRVGAAVRG